MLLSDRKDWEFYWASARHRGEAFKLKQYKGENGNAYVVMLGFSFLAREYSLELCVSSYKLWSDL